MLLISSENRSVLFESQGCAFSITPHRQEEDILNQGTTLCYSVHLLWTEPSMGVVLAAN